MDSQCKIFFQPLSIFIVAKLEILFCRTQINEVANVEGLYDDLMNLIMRLGNSGVIHGDFNEFNIMITEDQKPVLIDFPQMVSTSHPNAKMYFDRDVQGVREYFRKKFGYESEDYPKFDDLEREDNLDVEVSCSGFTKEMERDLLHEYGIDEDSEGDDDEENENAKIAEDEDIKPECTEIELNEYRRQVEEEVQIFNEKILPKEKTTKDKDSSVLKYIESMSKQLQENGEFEKPDQQDEIDVFEDAIDATPIQILNAPFDATNISSDQQKIEDDDAHSISSNDLVTNEEDDELSSLDPNSREYRFKMVRKLLDDAKSMRSYSTSASTIASTVVTGRVKKGLTEREKREARRKCVPKGEASAVRRMRKDNAGVVKEHAGWDF